MPTAPVIRAWWAGTFGAEATGADESEAVFLGSFIGTKE